MFRIHRTTRLKHNIQILKYSWAVRKTTKNYKQGPKAQSVINKLYCEKLETHNLGQMQFL